MPKKNSEKDSGKNLQLHIADSMAEIDATGWNACANPLGQEYNPFVDYHFLKALEDSGSATAETGWGAQHFILRPQTTETTGERGKKGKKETKNNYAAIMPLYLKAHSQGEYIFDQGWANAFQQAGGRYYPKLLCAIPFTPTSGRRLLTHPDHQTAEVKTTLIEHLQDFTKRLNLSSLHINFCCEDEWKFLGENNFLQRTDQQFHWVNDNYTSFDDFLNALASRKRKNLKKERLKARAHGIEIDWVTGSDLTETHWDIFYDCYTDTSARKWGAPYLTREFFSLITQTMADNILLIIAKRDGRPIAAALNFIGGDTLYGRNWGCLEDHPFLHFECCYYQAIDFAIARGLKRVEAGAQGPHKLARGYVPCQTYSAHFIPHEGFRKAVEDYLEQERALVENDMKILSTYTPFKKEQE